MGGAVYRNMASGASFNAVEDETGGCIAAKPTSPGSRHLLARVNISRRLLGNERYFSYRLLFYRRETPPRESSRAPERDQLPREPRDRKVYRLICMETFSSSVVSRVLEQA